MSSTARGVLAKVRSYMENNPTTISIAASGISFYLGWLGHAARQEHQVKIEQKLAEIQEELRKAHEATEENKKPTFVQVFGRSTEERKWLLQVIAGSSAVAFALFTVMGHRAGYPVGAAAAKAAIPSTRKELARIKQRTRANQHAKRAKRLIQEKKGFSSISARISRWAQRARDIIRGRSKKQLTLPATRGPERRPAQLAHTAN